MKTVTISIMISLLMIIGAIALSAGKGDGVQAVDANNVTIVDGKQIIEIKAGGGYSPQKSIAQAGIPTIIRFDTKNTFDCSSSVRIPSMNISQILPQTGTTDIDIGNPKVGIFQGMCGMGMYQFAVDFK